METEPVLGALDLAAVQHRRVAISGVLFDYWALTKRRRALLESPAIQKAEFIFSCDDW